MPRRIDAAVVGVLIATASLIAAGQQPQQPLQPPRDTSAQPNREARPATARITGRVVDAVTGRPMRLVRVMLTAPEAGTRGVQTDESGVFDFAALPAGRYSLSASRSGYVGLSYGQRRPLQPGTPIQLEEGQQLKDVEFRMPRGSVIAGTVYDELGDPMPGIAVRVWRYQYAQGTRQLTAAGGGQTDDRGAYRVWGLNPGEYYVSAVAPNFVAPGRGGLPLPAPAGARGARGAGAGGRGIAAQLLQGASGDDRDVGYAPTYYPGVPSVFEASPVTVALSAEMLDVNFNVLLVRTARVSGHVTNTDGTPVTAGMVNLAADGIAGRGGPGLNYGSRIQSDGAFGIPNVPPGRYTLRARGTANTFPQYAALPLTIAGDDLTNVMVVLAPGATLSGSVSFETTQSAAPPETTQLRVGVQPADGNEFGGSSNARIEKDGRFTLTGVPIGRHWIRAQGQRGWMLKSVVVDGREMIDTPLEVRSGEKIASVTLVFTDRLSEVRGTVVDQKGVPITELTVLAFPTDSALWRPQARQIMTARPDQNGTFQLRGLPAGDYYLAAVDPEEPGAWFDPAFLEQQRTSAARIRLADGTVTTHDLKITR
jgi:carboxypeptidase family protein